MTCPVCIDGLLIQEWTDAPHDFAVCLCEAGQAWRLAENEGRATVPQWRLWCARHGIDPARMFLVEDIYSREELAAVGLVVGGAAVSRESALRAAGKRQR